MTDQKQYAPHLDYMKGILTVFMVLAHCIQFFGDERLPIQGNLCRYINLTTFSGFLFAFGGAWAKSYLNRPFQRAAKGALSGAVKMLVAFILSSICFFAFIEERLFSTTLLWEVVTLQVFAGWSEFLAAFFVVPLGGLALFFVLKKMSWPRFFVIVLVGLLCCLLPYDKITNPWLSLLVGSKQYITFPLVQFFPYFAFGVICAQKAERLKSLPVVGLSALSSIPCVAFWITFGDLSGRFPPSVLFVLGGAGFVVGYYFLSLFFERVAEKAGGKLGHGVVAQGLSWLCFVGKNSLFYLLMSNLLIFAFKSSPFWIKDWKYAIIFWVVSLLICGYLGAILRGGALKTLSIKTGEF